MPFEDLNFNSLNKCEFKNTYQNRVDTFNNIDNRYVSLDGG
jgi:hypothetical protein